MCTFDAGTDHLIRRSSVYVMQMCGATSHRLSGGQTRPSSQVTVGARGVGFRFTRRGVVDEWDVATLLRLVSYEP
jgi:hypothetical protein